VSILVGEITTKNPNWVCVCEEKEGMVITNAKKSYLAEARNAF